MGKHLDLTGQTFGNLKVLSLYPKRGNHSNRYWLCECQGCGKTIAVRSYYLTSGHSKSCGGPGCVWRGVNIDEALRRSTRKNEKCNKVTYDSIFAE